MTDPPQAGAHGACEVGSQDGSENHPELGVLAPGVAFVLRRFSGTRS